MKVICTFSNLEYKIPEFSSGPNTQTTYAHPIFSWDAKQLLNQAGRWTRNELSPVERRLLFLAVLNKIDLCDWTTPAIPTDSTVQKNMEPLMRVLAWRLQYGERIPLVRITIRYPETHDIGNISIWIDRWNKKKTEYLDGYKTVFREEKQTQQEAILERLIKSTHRKNEDNAKQLAEWFITAADVPLGLREYWTSLFRVKGYEVFNIRPGDYAELIDHAVEHLGNSLGTIYGNATMKHLRMLELKNRLGLRAELIGKPKFSYEQDDSSDLPEITDNMIANSKMAPETKPQQSEIGSKYPTKIDYLRALAYWGQKQTVDSAQLAAEGKWKSSLIQSEQDIADESLDSEYQHLDDEDDLQNELPGLGTSINKLDGEL